MALLSTISIGLRAGEPDLSGLKLDGLHHVAVGVTREGRAIPAVITNDSFDVNSKKLRLLIVGGLNGSHNTTDTTIDVMRRLYSEDEYQALRSAIDISAVLCGNPDGYAKGVVDDNGRGSNPAVGYPPTGEYYLGAANAESQYLWRWIGMLGPDVVIVLVDGPKTGTGDLNSLPKDHLVTALKTSAAAGIGSLEAVTWNVAPGDKHPFEQVATALPHVNELKPLAASQKNLSPGCKELVHRSSRSPLDVCRLLANVYGRDLPSTAYIPAVAVIGRMRYGALIGDEQMLRDAVKLTESFRSGSANPLQEKSSASDVAGQILFAELADRTGGEAYKKLVLQAADRAFDASGQPLEAMPGHSEMSDSTFMSCPILAAAGRLSGDDKYFQMCVRHMHFMRKLNLRSDGLHRHSPLDETAWGRGNGFPALGLALVLTDMPENHPLRPEVLNAFRDHIKALISHQDVTGAWHQVIDHPESYREFTATCMITFAMARALQRGWIDDPRAADSVQRGWQAINVRIADDGGLVDVCTGTGKMKSLREYFDRPALLGKDGRGGAMALMVATEMAAYSTSQKAGR
ncbi:MAG: glycoside hydrolase family 88 protein [Pirellulales bacterium]